MKKYKAYKARKLRLPKRLLFFAVIALVIFGIAVLTGNILKNKLESAKINKEPIKIEDTGKNADDDDNITLGISHDEAELTVYAGCLDLTDIKDEEGVRAAVDKLRSDGYNAVSVRITDDDGMLRIASEKLEIYTKMKASEKLASPAILRYAASYASSVGMTPTAVMLHGNTDTDLLVISEISEAGFSEITLLGFGGASFDDETVTSFCDYISAMRTKIGIKFGVCFDKELFLNAKNTATLEKMFAVSDYFAVDFRKSTPEEISAVSEAVKGSFTYYMIRPLISSEDESAFKAVKEALSASDIKSIQVYASPPEKDTDATPDTTGTGES